jgi:hypothetical protein
MTQSLELGPEQLVNGPGGTGWWGILIYLVSKFRPVDESEVLRVGEDVKVHTANQWTCPYGDLQHANSS